MNKCVSEVGQPIRVVPCWTQTLTRQSSLYSKLMHSIVAQKMTFTFGVLLIPSMGLAVPPGYENKPMPAYPSKPGECYALLKPYVSGKDPYVISDDSAVCRAFLNNFNKFCDALPQYNRRKVHPSTSEIFEPKWQALDPKASKDLVKEVFVAHIQGSSREPHWEALGPNILSRVSDGLVTLGVAQLPLQLGGRSYEVKAYKLEGYQQSDLPGYEQPLIYFKPSNQSNDTESSWRINQELHGDIFYYRSNWYLVRLGYHDRLIHQWFTVSKIDARATLSLADMGAQPQCTLQYINDRKGAK